MNLTEVPEIVQWPTTHYVFIERTGPFMKVAPEAWGLAHPLVPLIQEHNQINGYTTLYRMNPNVYRAGFVLAAPPVKLPPEFTYELFEGGEYSRFVLTGRFSDLSAATCRVFELASKNDWTLRADWCIEHYVTDPRITPEDQNVIEILIPTA